MRNLAIPLLMLPLVALADDVTPASRPRMRQLAPTAAAGEPPGPHELVDARTELRNRFRDELATVSTPAGANAASAALLEAAASESDRRLKWLMLDEARELAAAAGNAAAVARAIRLASASYDFDAVTEEYRTLSEIPLRLLDPDRASALADAADRLAARASADGRREVATSAQLLAMRGWERAGDIAAARAAAAKVRELDPGREPGRR